MAAPVLLDFPFNPTSPWPASGTQFLPVSGHITDRLLVTYRAPARALLALVPEPFTLDTQRGFGFLSVCAVEIRAMGIAGMPRFLRFDNREFLYRLAVRFRGEPTFITLRSDVSSRALALLGRYFSHYRPRRAGVRLQRGAGSLRMECTSGDGIADAVVEADTRDATRPPSSIFQSAGEASRFLLGMNFSADAVRGRVRVQPIEHDPWAPEFAATRVARFAFLHGLERQLGARFEHDCTLVTGNLDQLWRAARWA